MAYYRLPYRYRYRRLRWRRDRRGMAIAASVAAGLALAFSAVPHHHHRPGHAEAADLAAAPSGGGYTPATWAVAFLRAAKMRDTPCNDGFALAWESAEGGNWANDAWHNPLNATYDDGGQWESAGLVTATINSDGVRAYSTWHTGLEATVITLYNGDYPGIVSCLQAGDDAQACADAVAASPWGTGEFEAAC